MSGSIVVMTAEDVVADSLTLRYTVEVAITYVLASAVVVGIAVTVTEAASINAQKEAIILVLSANCGFDGLTSGANLFACI